MSLTLTSLALLLRLLLYETYLHVTLLLTCWPMFTCVDLLYIIMLGLALHEAQLSSVYGLG